MAEVPVENVTTVEGLLCADGAVDITIHDTDAYRQSERDRMRTGVGVSRQVTGDKDD